MNETISCATLNPDCNGSGVCQFDGQCRCYVGWNSNGTYGGPYDCLGTLIDQRAPYTYLTIGLGISGCVAGICFLLALYRVLVEIKGTRKITRLNDAPKSRITLVALVLLVIQSAVLLVCATDYHGIYGRIGPKTYWCLWLLRDSLLCIIFSCILFHWVELYRYTFDTIRKQEMMSKMNANTNTNMTVEHLSDRLIFLSRFRIPFAFFAFLSVAVWLIYVVGYFLARSMSVYNTLSAFYSGYWAINWFAFMVAFAATGIRLTRLTSSTTSAESEKMTIKLCVILVVAFLDKIVSICYFLVIIPTKNPNIISIRIMCNLIVQVIILVVILEIYLPVSRFKEWFETVYTDEEYATSTSSESDGELTTFSDARSDS